jgi:tRNA threonylcarbamoyladenosine modification (KEOPS) complex  Pcc1 subunit
MKAKATVRLKLISEKKLRAVLRALEPEAKNPLGARSQASLENEGNLLVLKIEAKDSVALRANLNAYLRWINSILNVFETLEREKEKKVQPRD